MGGGGSSRFITILHGGGVSSIYYNITWGGQPNLLQYYNLTSEKIPYASERSPEKWGKYTIGTGIKMISEEESRALKPDYFLVTPWGFIEEFKKRESKWIKKGGKFILPFPKLRIVN